MVSCPHKCSVQTLLRSEVRHSQGPGRSPVTLGPVSRRLHSSKLQAPRVFMTDCGNVCNRKDNWQGVCEVRSKQKATKGKFRVENIKNWEKMWILYLLYLNVRKGGTLRVFWSTVFKSTRDCLRRMSDLGEQFWPPGQGSARWEGGAECRASVS